MTTLIRILATLVAIVAGLILIGWIGLQVQPASFAPYPEPGAAVTKTIPIPSGLPAPVERFYRAVYGDQVPVIESVVLTGRATLRPFGPITLPGRFRITHIAGQSYRHYIEATWFGIPIMKVNESYVDGKSYAKIPMFPEEFNQPKTNQGANLGLWSESVWIPSVFVTDPRVRWLPVDDATALLVVPFEDRQETYVVRFDEQTGLITWFESMRYHAANSAAKTLWMNQSVRWEEMDGRPFMKTGAAIWMDDGKPWATFTVENAVYNVDVSEYIRAKGE